MHLYLDARAASLTIIDRKSIRPRQIFILLIYRPPARKIILVVVVARPLGYNWIALGVPQGRRVRAPFRNRTYIYANCTRRGLLNRTRLIASGTRRVHELPCASRADCLILGWRFSALCFGWRRVCVCGVIFEMGGCVWLIGLQTDWVNDFVYKFGCRLSVSKVLKILAKKETLI